MPCVFTCLLGGRGDSKVFGGSAWFHLYIGPECENTFRWLIDHGYHEAMDN